MAAGIINFAIGGGTLTNQPSGIREIYPEVNVNLTLSGNRVIVESQAGPVVEVVFGVQAARAAIIAELRNARPASGSVAISYIDATGATTTRQVYMPKINYSQFLMTNAIEQMTLSFYTL